ncbi:NRDE family protein [Sphingomonas sp.]|uniref:NRDE family protein n=1 Tax=Sphingomonas sp. TaxID=28214 RepID=UPI002B92B2CF|nr:NRDE family protein [Sphingomonas sp.]HWK35770.1 NRDE family protein [Sphingomonas sp.]
MCVLAFAWRAHPRWQIILAGNRDEFHARPASALARWGDRPQLIAGRDLQSGGTCLGVSDAGRLAVVTNLRGYGGPAPDRASRGALVTDLLDGAGDEGIDPGDFNPFNLIAVADGRARFLTNRPATLRSDLAPGLYGLSNGALDAPWPKTLRLKSALLAWIVDGATAPERLFDTLREEALPGGGLDPAQPSDVAQEPRPSPIFIRDPVYGTRCSTVVAIDADGAGTIVERRFDADGKAAGETRIAFHWP